jgi:hypothetical protein
MSKVVGLVGFLALAFGIARGDSIIMGSYGWSSVPTSIGDGLGCGSVASPGSGATQCGFVGMGPYWDNDSGKGAAMNIGYFLTGTCGIAPDCPTNYTPQEYLSSGTGSFSSPLDISLDHTSSSAVVTLLADSTWDGTDSFGYYNASDTSLAAAEASEVPIFGPLIQDDPGAYTPDSLALTSGENYGFYLTRCAVGGMGTGAASCPGGYITLFSNASLNTCTAMEPTTGPITCSNDQHFSIFTSGTSGVFYVAIEDWGLLGGPGNGEANGDFNDVVFELNTAESNGPGQGVPEPATFGLIGAGLAGLGLARLRARKSRA